MQYKYYTLGSRDEGEGLTTFVNLYDAAGNFVGGDRHIETRYKVKEITKEEHDQIQKEFESGDVGFFGIVSENGKLDMEKKLENNSEKIVQASKKQIDKLSARLKRKVKSGDVEDYEDFKHEFQKIFPRLRHKLIFDRVHKFVCKNLGEHAAIINPEISIDSIHDLSDGRLTIEATINPETDVLSITGRTLNVDPKKRVCVKITDSKGIFTDKKTRVETGIDLEEETTGKFDLSIDLDRTKLSKTALLIEATTVNSSGQTISAKNTVPMPVNPEEEE